MEENEDQIRQYFSLQQRMDEMRIRMETLEETYRQEKNRKWQTHQDYVNTSDGLKGLWHRLRGTWQEQEETYQRRIRTAEAAMAQAKSQMEALKPLLEELEKQLKSLPEPEVLYQHAMENPETRELWGKLQAKRCLRLLPDKLKALEEAMEDLRTLLRGGDPGRIYSLEESHTIHTGMNHLGKEAAALLRQLREALELLGQEFPLEQYFLAPETYIEGMASKFNRMDRLNLAMDQVAKTRKQLTAVKAFRED